LAKRTPSNSSGDSSLPLIIVNPKSASGSTRDKWSATASEIRAHFGPFSVAFTKGPGDGIDIAERDLPQETSQMRALHFNKGCYLGQEIVERVRSRGAVHRHLRSLRIVGTVVPQPMTELNVGETKAGFVTSAAYSERLGQVVALGMVKDSLVPADLRLPDNTQVVLAERP